MSIDSSYALQISGIDPEDVNYQGTMTTMYQNYIAAKIAAEEIDPVDPDLTINPHFVRDGVRMFAKLASAVGRFYMRHKSTIDPFLDSVLTAAFTTIGSRAAEIAALNNRGPN